MVRLAFTRALVGAFAARASSAGCQHLRFTIAWFWLTTPWISPCESWPPAGGPVGAVATGPGTLGTKLVSSGAADVEGAGVPLGQGPPRRGRAEFAGLISPTSTWGWPLSSEALAVGVAVAGPPVAGR